MKIEAKPAILVIAILIFGILLGGLAHRAFVHHRIAGMRMHKKAPPHMSFAPHRMFVRHFMRVIDPTPEQKKQIRAVLEAHQDQFKEIENQFRSSTHGLAETVRQELDSILTPEQRERLDKRRAQHGKRFGMGPGKKAGKFGLRRPGKMAGPKRMKRRMMMLDSVLQLTPEQKGKFEAWQSEMRRNRE